MSASRPKGGPRFNVTSTQQTPPASIADELMGTPTSAAPVSAPPAAPLAQPVVTPRPAGRPVEPAPPAKVPIRAHVPAELADRVRGAVAALGYQVDGWSSLNSAVVAALEQFVADAEQQYNHGRPFPWEQGRQLQPGRKLGG